MAVIPSARGSEPAPSLLWTATSRGMTSNSQAGASRLALDGAGNAYVTGLLVGREMFGQNVILNGPQPDPSGPTSPNGNFLAKYDANGNLIWARAVTGDLDFGMGVAVKPGATAQTPTVYVLASTVGSNITFGSVTLPATYDGSFFYAAVFLAAYDASGNLLWARQIATGSLGASLGPAMKLDGSGNVYIAGSFSDQATFGDGPLALTNLPDGLRYFCLAKYDPAGNLLWVQAGSGYPDFNSVPALALDDSGNVFFADSFSSPLSWPVPPLPASFGDFLVKFDSGGNFIWGTVVADSALAGVGGLAVDHGGNAYLGGTFQGEAIVEGVSNSITISNGPLSLGLIPDSFLAKFGGDGSVQWVRPIVGTSGETIYDVALDQFGNPTVAGYLGNSGSVGLSGQAIFGTNKIIYTASPTPFLAKYGPDGGLRWLYQDGGSTFGIAWALAFNQNNQALVAAYGGTPTNYAVLVEKLAATEASSPPRIVQQPLREQIVSPGVDVTLAVTASGASPLRYQWYFNGTRLPGATGDKLLLPNIRATQAGTYRVEVRNQLGQITSSNGSILLGPPSSLPGFIRAESGGGFLTDGGTAVATDADGNYYTGGYFATDASFGTNELLAPPPFTFLPTDYFIAKHDPRGNLLWVRSGGLDFAEVQGLAVNSKGEVYVTGIPYPSYYNYYGGAAMPFTAKYDQNGNLLWRIPSGGNGIALDRSGNFWLTGAATTIIGFFPSLDTMFLAKYDPDGNVICSNSITGSQSGVSHPLAVDSFGNVYLTCGIGFVETVTIVDSAGMTNTIPNDDISLLLKFDGEGRFLWGEGSPDFLPSVAVDNFGAVYHSGSIDIPQSNGPPYLQVPVLEKFDTNGVLLWHREATPNYWGVGLDLATDRKGNIWWTGSFVSNITFGNTALHVVSEPSLYNFGGPYALPQDAFLAKYDSAGNLLGARQIDNSGVIVSETGPNVYPPAPYIYPGVVLPFGLAADQAGHVFVTGQFGNLSAPPGMTVNFGPVSLSTTGDMDYFVAELGLPASPPHRHPIRHGPFDDKRDFEPHRW